ncbi:HesA/MoeB/ThiF family protein [Marinoscillum sp. MHG1-6]|uniref:HesA/MoeB/ThiF family protein n=1 Tax=Marinoscillum sp. MHG1-6 TaxID=2959627 RepID=UPI002158816D|nr:HesA/MoeB/ThiF family protein [Marinoscillum sp. MHG1-6]
MFSPEEIKRYQRQTTLDQVGASGQELLSEAHILMVGIGGLGCPASQYLVAAGIGKLTLVDHDEVSESNLHRQILFNLQDIGQSKVSVAAQKLRALNPHVQIQTINRPFTKENALELVREADLVIDGTDNLPTKYLINDACILEDKPMVFASVYKFQGQLSVFNYQGGPSYRCLFPDEDDTPDTCEEVGVLGVVPGLLGVQQAIEAMKIILKLGDVLSGKLKLIDTLTGEDQIIEFERNEEVIENVKLAGLKENLSYCKIDRDDIYLDVRETFEQPRIDSGQVIEIPLRELINRHAEVPRQGKVVVCCQSGIRSRQAIAFLSNEYGYTNLVDLPGGVKELM